MDPGFEPDTASVIEMPDPIAGLGPQAALCRSVPSDGLSGRLPEVTVGGVFNSGGTSCLSRIEPLYSALNRSVAALAGPTVLARPGSPSAMRHASPRPVAGPGSLPAGQPFLLTESSTDIRIAAPMQFPGYVVLGDTYYPGWLAYVDGRLTPIVPANFAFRGVFVPTGRHIVEFRYEPFSFQAGAYLSGAAWLALCAVTISLSVARKRSEVK
jgi:hypothetical protein